MKKTLALFSLFLIVSCGVQKNLKSDPYVGSYQMTVFEVDNISSVIVEPDLGSPIINIGFIFVKIFFVELLKTNLL